MLSRILGMLLTAYSVQCVINGIAAAWASCQAAATIRESVDFAVHFVIRQQGRRSGAGSGPLSLALPYCFDVLRV